MVGLRGVPIHTPPTPHTFTRTGQGHQAHSTQSWRGLGVRGQSSGMGLGWERGWDRDRDGDCVHLSATAPRGQSPGALLAVDLDPTPSPSGSGDGVND